ncbi:hypothetical protein VNO78_28883 [Psophocarpus tetragonolobus]|uniref:Uncharacterized protein n=1 Tax=Psophocarpus tetragonolobus TaxID=3891 RepID=A0AAN9RU21_PSOTE
MYINCVAFIIIVDFFICVFVLAHEKKKSDKVWIRFAVFSTLPFETTVSFRPCVRPIKRKQESTAEYQTREFSA